MDTVGYRVYLQGVQKRHFPFVLTVILIVGWAAGNILGLILAALGLGIAYAVSLRMHPRMRHGRCNGSGEVRGSVFTWAHRRCPGKVCQGGRQIRWGARHFGAGHIQGEAARTIQAKTAAKDNNRWR